MITSTEAVVLNSRKYGESSKICSVYSKEYGRFSIIAKGARKPKSKFGSTLEPLNYISINFYKKQNKGLQLLSQAEYIINFKNIKYQTRNLLNGLAILESIYLTQEEGEKNEDFFIFLVETLKLLNNSDTNPFNAFVYFQLFLAGQLGFGIDFNIINTTINKNEYLQREEIFFSLDDNKVFHLAKAHWKNTVRLPTDTMRKIAEIATADPEKVCSIQLNGRNKKAAVGFFKSYFSYHLEKKFSYKSFEIMN